jgi:transcription initiation factor TFIIB
MKNSECSICKIGDKLVTDLESGEIVCSACGTVIIGQTRRDLTEDPASGLGIISGVGPYSSLAVHDMNLSTMMGRSKKDSSGQTNRLRTWDLRTQFRDSSLRNYRSAFSLLNNLKNKLAIPDSVVERTAFNYRKIEHKGFMRSRPITSVLAACLYLTCREMGVPRTMDEIQQVSNVKKKQLARDYREMVFNLELNVPPINYLQYLEKISSSLRFDERITRSAITLTSSCCPPIKL